MKRDFNWLVSRALLEANDAYMLGGRGRDSEGPAGFRRDTGLPDNPEVPEPDNFHSGVAAKHQGAIADPLAVRQTVQNIAQAMLDASNDPQKNKAIQEIFEEHIRAWEILRTNINQLSRAIKEEDKEHYAEQVQLYDSKLTSNRPLAFEKLASLLGNRDELLKYRIKRDGDRESAQSATGSQSYMLIDYIKSFSEFYKNAAHLAMERDRKATVVLNSGNLPEKLKALRMFIKQGPKMANKNKALELVDSAMTGSQIGDHMVQLLRSAVEKFYSGTGTESDVVKIIFSLSPANKMK